MQWGVDGGLGWGYKRGPAVVGRPGVAGWPGGLLIEIVGKGRDARAAARVAGRLRICERFGGPDMGPSARVGASLGCEASGGAGQDGWAWDKLESLILAQNERWRHA